MGNEKHDFPSRDTLEENIFQIHLERTMDFKVSLKFLKRSQNLQLKTKILKVSSKPLTNEHNIMYHQLKEKFEKLSIKSKQQSKWIKEISHTIEERNY